MANKKLAIVVGIIMVLAIIICLAFFIAQKNCTDDTLEIGTVDGMNSYHIRITPEGQVKVTKGDYNADLWEQESFIDEELPRYEYEMSLSESDTKELFDLAERTCEIYKEKMLYSYGSGDGFFELQIKYKNYRVTRHFDFDVPNYMPSELLLLKDFYDQVKEKTKFNEIETRGEFILPQKERRQGIE